MKQTSIDKIIRNAGENRIDTVMFNILSAWGWGTNPAYDPDTASNGGGYWQYAGGIVADVNGQLVTVEVDNTSCGDFGSRYYVDVIADGYHWRFVGGTMADASIDAPEEIDAVLAERKKNWKPRELRYKSGVLRMFSEHAASPMKGAYLEF